MLAEIAAANAAFQVIKSALSNGKELYDCSAAAQSYFNNKSSISKRVSSKGKSDLEAFMALEKIKAQEEWLKDYMIYAGRPDMWGDWLSYQAQCKQDRLKAERIAILKRRNMIKMIMNFTIAIAAALVIIPVFIYVLILLL